MILLCSNWPLHRFRYILPFVLLIFFSSFMNSQQSFLSDGSEKRLPLIGALALVCLAIAYRIAIPVFSLPWHSAPLMAIAFGGGMLLGGRTWWIPALALVMSDAVLGLIYSGGGMGSYTVMSAMVYILAAWGGMMVGRKTDRWLAMWCGTLMSGVAFYVVANTFSWLSMPEYAKTLAGWWQSQTTGLPQYTPPAWAFLRSALIADTVWCVAAGLLWLPRRSAVGEQISVAK